MELGTLGAALADGIQGTFSGDLYRPGDPGYEEARRVWNGMIDRHPALRDEYFRNYTRMVYLAQRDDPALLARARWAAESLGLPLEVRKTGYGKLESRLKELIEA